jgi:hypothetical protein
LREEETGATLRREIARGGADFDLVAGLFRKAAEIAVWSVLER